MHIDNWKPETYLPILKEVDVPYIPDEWNKLLASYGRDRSKVTGMTIFGRYLAKMRLNQYNIHFFLFVNSRQNDSSLTSLLCCAIAYFLFVVNLCKHRCV